MLFILIQDELLSPKIEDVLPADFMKTGWQCAKPLHLHWKSWSFQILRMIMRREGCKSRIRGNVSGCSITARPSKGTLRLQIRYESAEKDLNPKKFMYLCFIKDLFLVTLNILSLK